MGKAGLISAVCGFLVLFVAACSGQPASTEVALEQSTSTHLIIRFNVKADRLDDFLPIMKGVNGGMASEEGFIAARVYRNVDDSLSFTLVEEWASRADHQKHFDAISDSGDWDHILGMLTGAPDMSYNDVL